MALRTYDLERPTFKRYEQFIKYYDNKRVHMSLNYMTPRYVQRCKTALLS